jgi:hypothetical protein
MVLAQPLSSLHDPLRWVRGRQPCAKPREPLEPPLLTSVGDDFDVASVLELLQGHRLDIGVGLVANAPAKLDDPIVADVDAVVVVSPPAPDAKMIAAAESHVLPTRLVQHRTSMTRPGRRVAIVLAPWTPTIERGPFARRTGRVWRVLAIRECVYAQQVGYELSHAELEQHLAEQVSFLRVSAQAFDAGSEAEAKRLATSIRVLVHDTRVSKSLVGQLGLKESMKFEDTTVRREVLPPGMTAWPPGTITIHSGITVTQMKFGPRGGTKFAAPLADVAPERIGPPVEFAQWWEPIILTDTQGNDFSRKSFVLALANQDGGAHIDPELAPGYAALVKANSLGRMGAGPGQEMRPLLNIALATVRQIAHELLRTLERELPIVVGGPRVEDTSHSPLPQRAAM